MSYMFSLHPFVSALAEDRVLGCIVGAALGDCIGLYSEFLPRAEALRVYSGVKFSLLKPTEFRADNHRDKFEPGSWTDDTDQAILLILSYIHCKGSIQPNDVATRLRVWCTQGLRCLDRPPLGIGMTVGSVVLSDAYLNDPAGASRDLWLKTGAKGAANGSLMRTHPLGVMCVPLSVEETYRAAADMSKLTHADPRCIAACCITTALIRGLLRGEVKAEADVDAAIKATYSWVRSNGSAAEHSSATLDWDELERHAFAANFEALELDHGSKIGYVYKCLGAGIIALRMGMRHPLASSIDTFEQTITELVMHAGDADTNACVAGSLLGCWLGYSRLPYDWRKGMAHRDWLVQKAGTVSQLARIAASSEIPHDHPDAAPDGGKGFLTEAEVGQRSSELLQAIMNKQKARKRAAAEEEAARSQPVITKWIKGFGRSK